LATGNWDTGFTIYQLPFIVKSPLQKGKNRTTETPSLMKEISVTLCLRGETSRFLQWTLLIIDVRTVPKVWAKSKPDLREPSGRFA
jgi:hypothetical protein